jgi:hypothetical protein
MAHISLPFSARKMPFLELKIRTTDEINNGVSYLATSKFLAHFPMRTAASLLPKCNFSRTTSYD